MKMSAKGWALVKKWEGYHRKLNDGTDRCRAYWDAYGRVWTIGWGCTRGVREGMIWTREEAQRALEAEIAIHEAFVIQKVQVPLEQEHFDALTVFAYNCGNEALRTSTLLRKLNKGDYDGAHAEFKKWKWASDPDNPKKKIVVDGLTNRRRDEARLFEEGTIALKSRDERMWWEPDGDVVSVGEPQGQFPQAGREPLSPSVAATGAAAASGAAAVVSHAPEGTWTTFISTVQAFGAFAGSSIGIIAAIFTIIAVFWIVSRLLQENLELSK